MSQSSPESNTPSPKSLLFVGKDNDPHSAIALSRCRRLFPTVQAYLGRWGDPLPAEVRSWEGDYIVSYLSRWILPGSVLSKAKKAAINFHPASPDYPGIGCNNFALYDGVREFGVTCHHMAPVVDTGNVIAVARLPVYEEDTVETLLARTYDVQLQLFMTIVEIMAAGEPLPTSDETWSRRPITRKEFNELCRLTPEMDAREMRRRIRATSFGPWRPTLEINGLTFEYKGPA